MEIDEIAGHVECDQLPRAVAIVDIAADRAFQQQGAGHNEFARPHQHVSGRKLANLIDRGVERRSLLGRQALVDPPLQPDMIDLPCRRQAVAPCCGRIDAIPV
ncbi:hypothetical protein GCM10011380_26460 [Sphingomonas metalli]|uniref:Uncharacterized protein n=1 Tax=Sphingomonas metalli TaxID=1779358 RepID=A0A916WWQ7_9SPHN|nr:hypothetical protein GCM10011380_26460 [Sphingomonas metalli]